MYITMETHDRATFISQQGAEAAARRLVIANPTYTAKAIQVVGRFERGYQVAVGYRAAHVGWLAEGE